MDPFIGMIVMFGGNFAPRSWALCNGQLLPISQNTALFSILGTTYGGDGRTTFGLPDLRGRVAMHAGNGPGLSDRRLGLKGGTENNTLTVANLPAHNHSVSIPVSDEDGDVNEAATNVLANTVNNNYYSGDPTANQFLPGGNTSSVGGNIGVNNIQPFQCVNYIIALQGTFPSRS